MQDSSGRYARRDKPVDEFLPYVGHAVDATGKMLEGVALLANGSLVVQLMAAGRPLNLQNREERYASRRSRHSSLRQLYGANVEIYEHLISYRDLERFSVGTGLRSSYPRLLMEDYHDALATNLFRKVWLITIVVRPHPMEGIKGAVSRAFGAPPQATPALIRQAEDLAETAVRVYRDYGAVRRGVRWHRGSPFSEIGEGIRMAIYGEWEAVPLTRGLLARSIYTSRVICGMLGFEIQHPGRKSYGVVLGFEDYPEAAPPWLMDAVMRASCRLVMMNRLKWRTAAFASGKFARASRQMDNVRDAARTVREGNDDARDDIESGARISGDHQWALTIHGETMQEVYAAVRDVKAYMGGGGALAIVQEGLGTFPAFWSQVPGAPNATDARHGIISGTNFCSFSPMIGYPGGDAKPHWKRHLFRLESEGRTAVPFSPHIRRVGHTLGIGPTGYGKSTTLGFSVVGMEQCIAPEGGYTIVLDKDGSNQLTVLACNGTYVTMRRGVDSWMAPLKALDDSDESVAWLAQFVTGLIMADGKGPVPPYMDPRIINGLRFIMRRAPELRTLGGLRQFLDHGPDSTGARLERWCRGGALGWAFDGAEDRISFKPGLNGIDNAALLGDDAAEVRAPMAAYQLFRIRQVVGRGVRCAVAVDEAKSYVPDDESPFAEGFDAFSRDLRKGNGLLWMFFHHAQDLDSKLGRALIANSPRKLLFPNPNARVSAYRDLLNATEGEMEAVMDRMLAMGEGTFLVKEPVGSYVARIPLGNLPHHIAVLSADPNRRRLWHSIAADLGTTDADKILPHYFARHEEAAQ